MLLGHLHARHLVQTMRERKQVKTGLKSAPQDDVIALDPLPQLIEPRKRNDAVVQRTKRLLQFRERLQPARGGALLNAARKQLQRVPGPLSFDSETVQLRRCGMLTIESGQDPFDPPGHHRPCEFAQRGHALHRMKMLHRSFPATPEFLGRQLCVGPLERTLRCCTLALGVPEEKVDGWPRFRRRSLTPTLKTLDKYIRVPRLPCRLTNHLDGPRECAAVTRPNGRGERFERGIRPSSANPQLVDVLGIDIRVIDRFGEMTTRPP